jgi:hypothetical protein
MYNGQIILMTLGTFNFLGSECVKFYSLALSKTLQLRTTTLCRRKCSKHKRVSHQSTNVFNVNINSLSIHHKHRNPQKEKKINQYRATAMTVDAGYCTGNTEGRQGSTWMNLHYGAAWLAAYGSAWLQDATEVDCSTGFFAWHM